MRHLTLLWFPSLLLSGCSVYSSDLLGHADAATDSTAPPPTIDAPSGDSDSSATCEVAAPPARPPVQPPATAVLPPFVVAMKTLDFGDMTGGSPTSIGYDLDERCTTSPATASCTNAQNATPLQDGPGGRDNTVGSLLVLMHGFGFGSSHFNDSIAAGQTSVLIQVNRYNGTPNDEKVDVGVYAAAPLDSFPTINSGKPKWDGSDTWPLDPVSVDNGTPYSRDQEAYVSNGTLVARFNDRLIVNLYVANDSGPTLTRFAVWNAVLTGKIAGTGPAYSLTEGVLAGSLHIDNLLVGIGAFEDPQTHIAACVGTPTYALIYDAVCSSLDLTSQSQSRACNAMSIGMRFEASPAILGETFGLADNSRAHDVPDRCKALSGVTPIQCGETLPDGGGTPSDSGLRDGPDAIVDAGRDGDL